MGFLPFSCSTLVVVITAISIPAFFFSQRRELYVQRIS